MQLQPIVDAFRDAILVAGVIHANKTPAHTLAPGEKKTQRSYVSARSATPFSAFKAMVYDLSLSLFSVLFVNKQDIQSPDKCTSTGSYRVFESPYTRPSSR